MSTWTARMIPRLVSNLAAIKMHPVADHYVQTSGQAARKGDHPGHPDPAHRDNERGRRACTGHCVSYAATIAVAQLATNAAAGVRTHPIAWALGHALGGGLHYVMDRSRDTGRLIDLFDRFVFHPLGHPGNRGYWDHGGQPALDQAWHKTCLVTWAVGDAAYGAWKDTR